jgi:hypothetical protein
VGTQAVNWQTILTAMSFTTATLILAIGVVLLTGLFLPPGIPANYRYTLGAVMTLYASYRIWILWYKAKRTRDDGDPGDPDGPPGDGINRETDETGEHTSSEQSGGHRDA